MAIDQLRVTSQELPATSHVADECLRCLRYTQDIYRKHYILPLRAMNFIDTISVRDVWLSTN